MYLCAIQSGSHRKVHLEIDELPSSTSSFPFLPAFLCPGSRPLIHSIAQCVYWQCFNAASSDFSSLEQGFPLQRCFQKGRLMVRGTAVASSSSPLGLPVLQRLAPSAPPGGLPPSLVLVGCPSGGSHGSPRRLESGVHLTGGDSQLPLSPSRRRGAVSVSSRQPWGPARHVTPVSSHRTCPGWVGRAGGRQREGPKPSRARRLFGCLVCGPLRGNIFKCIK